MTWEKPDDLWVRRKMGHLLLHLNTRENWKLKVIGEILPKKVDDPTLEIKGVTDHNIPTNWGLSQEANTIRYILGYEFNGTFGEALEAIREFVYGNKENTECDSQNSKSESPAKPLEDSSSKPAQDQERPTP